MDEPNMWQQATTILLLTLFVLGGTVRAADGPLLTTGPGREFNSFGTRGYSFDIVHELTVTGLAKFDANNNGTLDDLTPPQVGIWDTQTSDLIVSTFIGDESVLRDGMFVQSIAPVVLSPGTYTVGAEFFSRQEPSIGLSQIQSFAGNSPPTPLRSTARGFSQPTLARAILPLTLGPNLIIEQPPIVLTEPYGSVIAQRQDNDMGTIRVAGVFDTLLSDSVQVRAVALDGGTSTSWQTLPSTDGQFSRDIEYPGGWYQIEARSLKGGENIFRTSTVRPVGVGEIFVVAGQSNSANHGIPTLTPEDERVLALNAQQTWLPAVDPQPLATGLGGSPWPVFGDLLAEQLGVPIGIASVGWGGTSVQQWLPGEDGPAAGPLYDRLGDVLKHLGPNGARAVLWHQGETDALNETDQETYAVQLSELITQTRTDAGFEIPWGVALAAFQPQNPVDANGVILDAQRDVIRYDPLVFAGPNTDLLGPELRYDKIHFNEEGLRVHGELWADAVQPLFARDDFLAADFDESGTIDNADFLVLFDAFGKVVNPAGTDPDIDGSGVVDFADFLVISETFGDTSRAAASVPEPTTLSLSLFVIGYLLRHRRSRSKDVLN